MTGVGEGLVTTMSFPEFAQKSLAEGPYAYYMCLGKSGQLLKCEDLYSLVIEMVVKNGITTIETGE